VRYYLDTEFDGLGGELMSLALVPGDSSIPSFYRVVHGPWVQGCRDEWVTKNVLPFLYRHGGVDAPVDRETAARDLSRYLSTQMHQTGKTPVIIADWPTDFSQLLDLFIIGPGQMVGVPDFDMAYRGLKGFATADHSKVPHNALADAEALRDFVETILA
jgi:hypothetical protein